MSLIINADDFGFNKEINKAIILSFKKGLCSSTTLMPNMPGFKDACWLAHVNNLMDHIGMHLVLTEGYPLTKEIKHFTRFCNKNGQFCFSQEKPTICLEVPEKEALYKEITAQIKKCRNYGIPITHIDSHHHIHNQWGIVKVLIPIAYEQDIQYIRISRNCGYNLGLAKRLYKYVFNYKLKREHLTRTNFYTDTKYYKFLKQHMKYGQKTWSFELGIHPILSEKHTLIDRILNIPLKEVIQSFDGYKKIISYSGVKYL